MGGLVVKLYALVDFLAHYRAWLSAVLRCRRQLASVKHLFLERPPEVLHDLAVNLEPQALAHVDVRVVKDRHKVLVMGVVYPKRPSCLDGGVKPVLYGLLGEGLRVGLLEYVLRKGVKYGDV